jgi:putative membrane protein
MITLMEETAKATAISTAEQTAKQVGSQVASQVSKKVATKVANSAKEKATNTTVSSLTTLSTNIETLTNGLKSLDKGTTTLYNGIVKVNEGANKLNSGALSLNSGANSLNTGALTLSNGTNTLTSGITTLNSSVKTAKEELDSNIDTTKEEVKKVESLADYAKEPVKVNTVPVNEVSSYGTAFSPLFISIGLWVGCLMMYVVLYYDKDKRFGLLGKDDKRFTKRTLCYHGLVTISAIILGVLLQLLLDFSITNVVLYYFSIILIANLFTSIIDFLIINFNDIGKFLALIILVLQLAAAGGTFPIETVTKGFRWLNNILPMKYTIDLLKESLIAIESKLLTKNLIIVISIFLVFFIFNIINDKVKEKKAK